MHTNYCDRGDIEVSILCQHFYPELVSTGQTLTELAEELTGSGVSVQAICGPLTVIDRESNVPAEMDYKGIKIKRVWGTRFSKHNLPGRITNQITFFIFASIYVLKDRSTSPVMVFTNPPFLPLVCTLSKIFKKRPYILIVFDVYPDTPEKLGVIKENGIIAKLWNFFNGIMYKNADRVVVIGRCMKELLEHKFPHELQGKIELVHVWADDALIRESEDRENSYISGWGLEGKFVLIYSGNMGRFHDMETVMETAQKLQKEDDIVFLLVGEGHKKSYCQDFAASKGINNCRFHTYVPREDLGLSLRCGSVGLITLMEGQEGLSVPSKTFGIMAAGLPIIAVVPSTSEIARLVKEEECGFVVRPGRPDELYDAVMSLYQDPARRLEMGRNAASAVLARYNLKSAAQSYLKIIKEVNSGR